MTQPVEVAYAAAASAISAALVGCGFVPATGAVEIDPPAQFEPSGDETALITAAAVVKTKTGVAQAFVGGPRARYSVEREFQVELAAAAPDKTVYIAALQSAVSALAVLPALAPTLSGTAETFEISGDAVDDDLPPNGARKTLTFILRVRAGDPLGTTSA